MDIHVRITTRNEEYSDGADPNQKTRESVDPRPLWSPKLLMTPLYMLEVYACHIPLFL